MFWKKKDKAPSRPARAPAQASETTDPERPEELTFLGLVNLTLADDARTRNLRRIVRTVTFGLAVLVGLGGVVLVHVAAPVGIAALSTVGTIVGTFAGIRAVRRGNRTSGTDGKSDPPD